MGTLWHVGKEPKPVEKSALPSEKLLEEMLVANLRILSPDWMLLGNQISTGTGYIDILAVSRDGSLVIFDTVPGGAGYSRLINESLEELTTHAAKSVKNCRCGMETACYACLKSHENQHAHEHLQRELAIEVFESMGL